MAARELVRSMQSSERTHETRREQLRLVVSRVDAERAINQVRLSARKGKCNMKSYRMIGTGGGLVANKFVPPPPYAAATAKMANVIIRIAKS